MAKKLWICAIVWTVFIFLRNVACSKTYRKLLRIKATYRLKLTALNFQLFLKNLKHPAYRKVFASRVLFAVAMFSATGSIVYILNVFAD